MKLVILNEQQSGKRLALPIYTKTGITYIKEGAELTPFIIKKINSVGIISGYIEEDEEDEKLREIIDSKIKIQILDGLVKCFEEIAKTKTVPTEKVKGIIRLIIDHMSMDSNTIMINNFIQDSPLFKMAIHVLDVAIYGFKIATQRGYTLEKIEDLIASALLHDIGKLFTEEENHMQLAYNLVRGASEFGATVFVPILHIHENLDGSGPMGIGGETLYEGSQILHIANSYVNLQIQDLLPHEIIERLSCEAANQFDMELFRDSMRAFSCYPNGLPVVLNTGANGVVVRQNIGVPMRPIIKCKTADGKKEIDLNKELHIFIEKIDQ